MNLGKSRHSKYGRGDLCWFQRLTWCLQKLVWCWWRYTYSWCYER